MSTKACNILLSRQPLPQLRFFCSNVVNNNIISPILTNRNPRNLERLRIAYKPDGYHLEKKGRSFWHKLELTVSGRYVSAHVKHFENGKVIKASTNEWAFRKQLYSTKDYSAYINLARVLAHRCLQMGVAEIRSDMETTTPDGKIAGFLKTLADSGITLSEPPRYKPSLPTDLEREEKPWEVTE